MSNTPHKTTTNASIGLRWRVVTRPEDVPTRIQPGAGYAQWVQPAGERGGYWLGFARRDRDGRLFELRSDRGKFWVTTQFIEVTQ